MDPFVGEIRMFCGTFAPEGWLLCQGQTVPITTYQALYAILGTHFGGNGSTTFGIPNLQARMPIGVGVSPAGHIYQLGQQGGSELISLGLPNLPTHTHQAASPAHTHPVTVPAHDHSYTDLKHTHTIELGCDDSGGGANVPSNAYFSVPNGGGGYSSNHPDKMATQTTDQNAGTATGTTGPSSAVVGASGPATTAITVQNTGAGAPFDPRNLFLTINYIIAYSGLFPTQS